MTSPRSDRTDQGNGRHPIAPPAWLMASAEHTGLITDRLLRIAQLPAGGVNRRVVFEGLDDLIEAGAFPTTGGVQGVIKCFLDRPDDEPSTRMALGRLLMQTSKLERERTASSAAIIIAPVAASTTETTHGRL